jgi:hypothetical protein
LLLREFHDTSLVPRAESLIFTLRYLIPDMSRPIDGVRCTFQDGEMLMHLDNVSVNVPSELLKRSPVLMDALSVADPSAGRKVNVAAPKEWLQTWVGCYCNEEESLRCDNINDLVHCLLVCFSLRITPAILPTIATLAVAMFIACQVLGSTALFNNVEEDPTIYHVCVERSNVRRLLWQSLQLATMLPNRPPRSNNNVLNAGSGPSCRSVPRPGSL